jgi:N-acetylglucosamine malate deacetylase 2
MADRLVAKVPAPASDQPASGDVPRYRDVTVVCAHPDDESFGLGALVTAFRDAGAHLRLVCFTAGESSTLGASLDLDVRRAAELDCAARALGIDQVILWHHPDGALATVPLETLAAEVVAAGPGADALLTFDQGGITGHPDHEHATAAAVAAARQLGIPVWGWAIPEPVAAALRAEFGTPFVGREDDEVDLVVPVDRTRQQHAVACHGSQLVDNPVPRRRIELSGATEALRLLHDPAPPPAAATASRQEIPSGDPDVNVRTR